MAEFWELVDINKKKTGIIHERKKGNPVPAGMYHLSVDIWVKNSKGELLLTQRHPNKHYGLLWECSGGAVTAGESSIEGACRELYEETGIKADCGELVYLGDTIKSDYIVETYLCKKNYETIELKLQKEEVADALWISPERLESSKEMLVDLVWERYCQFKDKIKTM